MKILKESKNVQTVFKISLGLSLMYKEILYYLVFWYFNEKLDHKTPEKDCFLKFKHIQSVPGGMDKTSGECSLC